VEHGQVRAILGRHARPGHAAGDPTLFIPASTLRRILEDLPAAAQRALGRDYADLWARTFRTLARHLRGRPERALVLFAEEVYPFLRGDRRAARLERAAPGRARLLLPGDLPSAYHCGMLEGFTSLSSAQATAHDDGAGHFTVHYRVAAVDRLARAAQQLAAMRLPLLACVALAALTGAVASLAGLGWTGLSPLVVVAGVVAAQLGANAMHALRRPTGSPFAARGLPKSALVASAVAAYALAGVCAALATQAAGWPVLAFAAIGLGLGLAYARVREGGLGPAVAGLTYGVLVPVGSAYALVGPEAWPLLFAVLLALPLGLAAAAMLLLDNIADRPLDEAGGQRTLAVRLGGRGQVLAFTGLAVGSLAVLAVVGVALFWPVPVPAVVALLLAPLAAWTCRRVARNADDPRALGAARLGTLLLVAAVAVLPLIDLLVFL
jgi:1,4-dihydroxy-2-naphthoate polyprenyltransferase